jgi:hypothetical protein
MVPVTKKNVTANALIYPVYDDDVYLRLQHGKGFHDLVYMSYVTHKPSL